LNPCIEKERGKGEEKRKKKRKGRKGQKAKHLTPILVKNCHTNVPTLTDSERIAGVARAAYPPTPPQLDVHHVTKCHGTQRLS